MKVAFTPAQFYLFAHVAAYPSGREPAGFIAPCLPTKTDKLPSGSQWLHEIKRARRQFAITDAWLRHFALEMCEVAHTLAWGHRASIPHVCCEMDACHAGVAKIDIAT